jgi:hypothetical protein
MRSFHDFLPNPGWVALLVRPFHDFLGNPEWVAALALLIQAMILIIQAKILGRHAETMEEHTGIAGSQAKTAELIGLALDQQGKILAEQTTIMDEQVKFQRSADARVEKGNLLNLAVEVQSRLERLASTLSGLQQSAISQEDQHDVADRFDRLAVAVTECQKAVLMAIHLSDEQRKYFSDYCHDLATLDPTGNMVEDFKRVDALKAKHGGSTFFIKLGSLTKSPEEAKFGEKLFVRWGQVPSDLKSDKAIGVTLPHPATAATKQLSAPSDVKLENVANLYWLGSDLDWTAQTALRGAPKERILHGLTQSYHHISELRLAESPPGKQLSLLKSETASLPETALDRAWRGAFSEKIYDLTRMIDSILRDQQPGYRPSP